MQDPTEGEEVPRVVLGVVKESRVSNTHSPALLGVIPSRQRERWHRLSRSFTAALIALQLSVATNLSSSIETVRS